MRPPIRDLGPDLDLGRMKHEILPSRSLRLLAGARVTVMKPSSLRTKRSAGGVGETRITGGEQAKQVTPLAGGEVETVVAEVGEVEEVGVHLIMAPARVVAVDGALPIRTTKLLIRPNRLRKL